MLGYGETDKPDNVEAYAFKPLCKQLSLILDAEGIEKVVGLGHDFGIVFILMLSSHTMLIENSVMPRCSTRRALFAILSRPRPRNYSVSLFAPFSLH